VCGAKEGTAAHVLCESEALATSKYVYLSSFLLHPEDVRNLSLGAIWNPIKGTRLVWFGYQPNWHKGSVIKELTFIGTDRTRSSYLFYSSYKEIIAVCSQIQTKHINTLCGQNVEFDNVKPGGTYSDHWAVKG